MQMVSHARIVFQIIFLLLLGCKGSRIAKSRRITSISAHHADSSNVVHADPPTEQGATIDQEANSTDPDDKAVALGPDEYWAAENALARCRSASSLRTTKAMIGAPIAIVVGGMACVSVVSTAWLRVGVQAATAAVSTGITMRKKMLTTAAQGALVEYTVADKIGDAIMAFFTAVYSVFGDASMYTFIIPSGAYLTYNPVLTLMAEAEELASVGSETAMKFMGYGAKHPSCCCAPVNGKGNHDPGTCVLVAASDQATGICPDDWTHDATQCATPEIVKYSDTQTVAGCQCNNAVDCGSNAPWKGHAWCEIQGSECGFQYSLDGKRRWDYCRVDGSPLEFAEGDSSAPNDALATFIPNEFADPVLLPGADNVFSLGTWVDPVRGITTSRPGFFNTSQCFAGEPVETLGACAKLCLEDGAPTARTAVGQDNHTHKCVAFAYHRSLHLCVRLPEFATDAKFTPELSEWTGDGWQNFVSKFHGRDVEAVCPSEVLLNIRNNGYHIVRDKNNGHLYVQCANTQKVQKVSCIESECDNQPWCFVKNHCRSNTAFMLGGCWRLTGASALNCAGTHGAVVPDNGEIQSGDLQDATKTLSDCWTAAPPRMVKEAVATPVFSVVGDSARMTHLEGGIYEQPVENIFQETEFAAGVEAAVASMFSHSFSQVYDVGGMLLATTSATGDLLLEAITSLPDAKKLAVSAFNTKVTSKFVGYGPQYPLCCCPDTESAISGDNKTRACALSASLAQGGAQQCPSGWTHDASQCSVPEVTRYAQDETINGCQCANYNECMTKAPYHGHAWCLVSSPENCGFQNKATPRRWDYCKVDSEPMAFAEGVANTALASFVPNEFTRSSLLGTKNPIRVGSWTDTRRAVTTAKPNFMADRKCFMSVPVETRGACAKACIEEGAPASTKESNACVAFAYNRAKNLCVRLPAFAADAKYTPMLLQWGGEGWQNFVLKSYASNLKASCPAMTLLNMRDQGFAVAKDKNNGHLYLRCANQPDGATQKVSCLETECIGQSSWCFVQKGCGGWSNCTNIGQDQNPLNCQTETAADEAETEVVEESSEANTAGVEDTRTTFKGAASAVLAGVKLANAAKSEDN